MAPVNTTQTNAASGKISFWCCQTKQTCAVLCTTCGKVYHKSCATRDWAEKLKIIDETRVVCRDHVEDDITSNQQQVIMVLEDLVNELKSKNQVLMENNSLLREKVEDLEKKFSRQQKPIMGETSRKTESRVNKAFSEVTKSPEIKKNNEKIVPVVVMNDKPADVVVEPEETGGEKGNIVGNSHGPQTQENRDWQVQKKEGL